MRVIGIDPGYGRLGVAVVEKKEGKEGLLFSHCLATSPSLPFPQRLLVLGRAFDSWCRKYRPATLAIEEVFFAANRKTALRVAEVRGLLLYLAARQHLTIIEVTPLEVKMAISGYGRADKKQVAAMAGRCLRLDKKIGRTDDEFDALAVALTALFKHRDVIHTKAKNLVAK